MLPTQPRVLRNHPGWWCSEFRVRLFDCFGVVSDPSCGGPGQLLGRLVEGDRLRAGDVVSSPVVLSPPEQDRDRRVRYIVARDRPTPGFGADYQSWRGTECCARQRSGGYEALRAKGRCLEDIGIGPIDSFLLDRTPDTHHSALLLGNSQQEDFLDPCILSLPRNSPAFPRD